MGDGEFDEVAADAADVLQGEDLDTRIAAACRGSGNPAALEWLAAGLDLDDSTRVVDLGSGLGGPAAWIVRRHSCPVAIALEPAAGAAHGSAALFDIPVVRGAADRAPFRSGQFDGALLLGVLSVVRHPIDALAEAARVAARVGVMDYCSTTGDVVEAGGSSFPTLDQLVEWVDRAGLVVTERTDVLPDPPEGWEDAAAKIDHVSDAHPEAEAAEREVSDAIEAGALAPQLLLVRHG